MFWINQGVLDEARTAAGLVKTPSSSHMTCIKKLGTLRQTALLHSVPLGLPLSLSSYLSSDYHPQVGIQSRMLRFSLSFRWRCRSMMLCFKNGAPVLLVLHLLSGLVLLPLSRLLFFSVGCEDTIKFLSLTVTPCPVPCTAVHAVRVAGRGRRPGIGCCCHGRGRCGAHHLQRTGTGTPGGYSYSLQHGVLRTTPCGVYLLPYRPVLCLACNVEKGSFLLRLCRSKTEGRAWPWVQSCICMSMFLWVREI